MPFTPPMSPLGTPTLSRTGTVATAPITVNGVTINVTGDKTPELTAQAVKRMFLSELDKTKNATGGLNGSRGRALEVMS